MNHLNCKSLHAKQSEHILFSNRISWFISIQKGNIVAKSPFSICKCEIAQLGRDAHWECVHLYMFVVWGEKGEGDYLEDYLEFFSDKQYVY